MTSWLTASLRLWTRCQLRPPGLLDLSGHASELAELLPWLAALLDQGDAGWSRWAVPAERG
ncbi:hypothetical protein [Dactylosporangium sp. NPDC049140]|uniref:hypothetical protein n=1 Tax=Dactylosporangium sp. NPDC049140 TaxID=3155647 RepID=UPI0033D6FF92